MAAITPHAARDELKWPNSIGRPDCTLSITNWDIPCHVLYTKKIPGDFPACVDTTTLGEMLLECWEHDVHFTQYVTDDEIRCVKTRKENRIFRGEYGTTTFRIAAFDLDSHTDKPTLADYRDLQTTIIAMSGGGPGGDIPMPNIMYRTRGGARLIYIIKPIYDRELFERSHAGLFAKLDEPLTHLLNAGISKYELDKKCKEWVRLFRAPLVRREVCVPEEDQPIYDEEGEIIGYWPEYSYLDPPEYFYHIGQFHEEVLDIETLAIKPKKQQIKTADGTAAYRANDQILAGHIHRLREGNRNNEFFSGCCYIYRTYAPQAAERHLEMLRRRALNEGLREHEIYTAEASARQTIANSR